MLTAKMRKMWTPGPTETRTRVAGFKVQSDNRYTMGPNPVHIISLHPLILSDSCILYTPNSPLCLCPSVPLQTSQFAHNSPDTLITLITGPLWKITCHTIKSQGYTSDQTNTENRYQCSTSILQSRPTPLTMQCYSLCTHTSRLIKHLIDLSVWF